MGRRIVCATLLCWVMASGVGAAEPPLSPRLIALQRELAGRSPRALDEFWREVEARGAPLVEPVPDRPDYRYVTFVWRGKPVTRNVLVSTLEQIEIRNGEWLEKSRMARLEGSDVWYKTWRVRDDARFTYQFSPDDPLTLLTEVKREEWGQRSAGFVTDPLNPRRFETRNGMASVLELPRAPAQPWLERLPGVASGTLEEKPFRSAILGNERTLTIYTSAGGRPRALLVIFDASTYLGPIPMPVILDNLVARGLLPPLRAVFVDNFDGVARGRELGLGDEFQAFLARELMPWVRKTYPVAGGAGQTVAVGSSLGGTAAVFSALRHPEIFGNVLSQSGGFQRAKTQRDDFKAPLPGQQLEEDPPEYEWLAHQLARQKSGKVRFYLEAGMREEVGWKFPVPPFALPSFVAATRHLRDVLEARGHEVHYAEYNGGHEVLCWRGSVADGLIALIGTKR